MHNFLGHWNYLWPYWDQPFQILPPLFWVMTITKFILQFSDQSNRIYEYRLYQLGEMPMDIPIIQLWKAMGNQIPDKVLGSKLFLNLVSDWGSLKSYDTTTYTDKSKISLMMNLRSTFLFLIINIIHDHFQWITNSVNMMHWLTMFTNIDAQFFIN